MPAAVASAIRKRATPKRSGETCATAMSRPRRRASITAWSKAMTERTVRVGVDVGGTFTDLVLHDPQRNLVHTGKLLTTPDDPSEAIVGGVERILKEAGLKAADVHSIVHGTTLVTNTVI